MISIEDPADPRVAPFRDIRERDLVGREGRFVAEGEVVLRVLAASATHRTEAVLIDRKRAAKLADLIDRFERLGAPVYAAGQGVLDDVAGFHLHRGLLAIGRRGVEPRPDELLARLDGSAIVLALFGISNHDNMGGLFRNAAAFGAAAVLLDAACCDPLYRKAIRVSVGHALTMPFARFDTDDDPLSLLRGAGFTPLALTPSGAPLAQLDRLRRPAVMLGAEGAGLPAALIAAATPIGIPMAPGVDSLNVAVTAGIVLHHLRFLRP
ncbi:MAG: RNA methyltransferase [Caulobacteraceae bacterium]|nr:RNA methyltransferase [Caulobacteraceae bacterium]